MQFRDLGAQYARLKDDIDRAVAEVLNSGTFIGGPPVKELERELADYVGVKHCITCGNGTDALQLALMVWGIRSGDAVFVPDFTFFSSGEVISAVGATPVFVDVDSKTFNICPERLERAIDYIKRSTKLRPRVVIAVDLFGLPVDYSAILSICKENELLLLEDGAQGFGGSINDKMACSFGDISTTSFFPAKPLGCYGDGGAVFTDDDKWAQLIRSYAVHGKSSTKYDNIRIGVNSRLDTIQAAILNVKLQAFIDYELDSVNAIAQRYTQLATKNHFDELGIITPSVPDGATSSWAQYTVILPSSTNRDDLRAKLRCKNIPSMVYYPKPMHEQLAFGPNIVVPPGGCETTVRLCSQVLSVPMGPYLKEENLHDVIDAFL